MFCYYVERHYTEWCILFTIMLKMALRWMSSWWVSWRSILSPLCWVSLHLQNKQNSTSFCIRILSSVRTFFYLLRPIPPPLNFRGLVILIRKFLERCPSIFLILIIWEQSKRISHKQSARWQLLSRLKASAFFSLQKISCLETQQPILVIDNVIQ